MKQRKSGTSKKAPDFPEETEGSRLAAAVRTRANKLTPAQRREYFRKGMTIIYGGKSEQEATRAGL